MFLIRYSIARNGHSRRMNSIHVGLILVLLNFTVIYYTVYVAFGNYYNISFLNVFEVSKLSSYLKRTTTF